MTTPLQCCRTPKRMWSGERVQGGLTAAGSIKASCHSLDARAVQEAIFPAHHALGRLGWFSHLKSETATKENNTVTVEEGEGRGGRGSQSVEVQWFPNMSLTAWMLYISVFCLKLAVKESIAWAGKLSSVSHVPKWKVLIISRPF